MQRHSSDNDGISSNDPSSSSSSHPQKRQGGSDEDSASSATPYYSPDDLDGSLASLFEGLRGGISGEVGGNKEVQDALDTVMQMSVRKAQVKEDILADLETKKERLRSIGEELTEEFGREIELDKARAELASNLSLSETLDRFKEVEDEVQAVRDQLQLDKKELEEWEEKQAAARNQGLFFQKLYKVKDKRISDALDGSGGEELEGEGSRSRVDEGDEEERKARAISKIRLPANQEIKSPWRSWVYLYLCLVLTLVVLQDLIDAQSPSFALDTFYGGLAALMAFTAWKERSMGDEEEEEEASRDKCD